MKKNIMLATAIVVVGLMITSAASSLSIQQTDLKENEIVAHYLSVQSLPIAKKTIDTNIKPLSVAMTGGDFDEYHPSVAGAPGGEYYAMAEYSEDGFIWHPMLYGSLDGVVWDPLIEFLYDNAEYTDMDSNDHGTYGTFGAPPDDSGIMPLINGEDPESSGVWDWSSYNLYDFSHNTLDCYTFEGPEGDPGLWNFGGITCSGYNGWTPGSEFDGCPYVFYCTGDGYGTIGWLTGDVAGCENVGSAIDLETNMHYAVFDRDTGGNYDLLVRKDNFGTWVYNSGGDYWTHPYVTSIKITDTANLKFPSAAADNNNVIVACQKDADVIVYYSTNGFSGKVEVLVESEAAYPEVAIAGDGVAVITYIKGGTMYYKTSDDKGATWSSAEVVSDNQININDQSANLDTYNGNIICVWEDTRGDNVDIYYDMIYEVPNDPPLAPAITGPNGGKKGTSYTFNFNSEDPNEDQVRYIIDWGDETSDTTGYADEGTNVPFAHTYAEDGAYTIKAYAQDILGATGPESEKTFNVKRSKALDFSIFSFLENHPNLFPVLRQLLGL